MSTHDIKIKSVWLERVISGEKRAEIRKHDRDYQTGDVLSFIEVNEYGNPRRDYVERDKRGRFVNDWVARPHINVRITHVLDGRQADGIDPGYCLLSIELINPTDGAS